MALPSAPGHYGLFPLTAIDWTFERTTFVTGWLVEGTINKAALSAVLLKVTEKWRLLSGRGKKSVKWHIEITLGPFPDGYSTYALTTSTSPVPLSKYVTIPLPSAFSSPPPSLFIHTSTPRKYTTWEEEDHPLTCWNLTFFPASLNNGSDYTCIGFSRCHGIFDGGGGAGQIINAVVAELHGKDWKVPPLPNEGINVNPVDEILARESLAEEGTPKYLWAYHVKEKLWKGAGRRIIIIPKATIEFIVEDVKSELRREKTQAENVSTGDILVAWVFKTIYSSGTSVKTIVHCVMAAISMTYTLQASRRTHGV